MLEMIFGLPGIVMLFAGAIWFLIVAFQVGPEWGIGCLICGPVQLVFLIIHFDKAWKPLAMELAGVALIFLGTVFGDAPAPPPGFGN